MAQALQMENKNNLIEVRDLVVRFRTDEGIVSAVNSVSYDIPIGETVGTVGESGCGKSVTSNAIMRILPENGWIVSGSILFNSNLGVFDISSLPEKDKRLEQLHGREMAMIFQEPMTSFCPVYTIGNQIIESIRLHTQVPKSEWRNYAIEL
ncbi:MAG: ABC transporter ATP-binding protein, partial [Clostridiales bacterium]|nr:ABC transporter ATP-binding protein [Clostridiales bacterium]